MRPLVSLATIRPCRISGILTPRWPSARQRIVRSMPGWASCSEARPDLFRARRMGQSDPRHLRLGGPLWLSNSFQNIAKGEFDEENIPAAQQEQKTNPWLSREDAYRVRQRRDQKKARQGEKTSYCLMGQTLARTERLGKRDFRKAKWARSGRTPHFLLFKSKNEDSGRRFGVVVSRKIKGAVRRNRIKRLLREFFRLNKELFRECTNYSVRVMIMPASTAWDTVSRELHLLVAKAIKE